jgi:hypothetical protein
MDPEWLLTLFMVIGAIACFAWRQRRWLVWAELVIIAFYVATAGIDSHLTRLFTGPWYNDSHRIAAILPIVAVPLATTGVLAVADVLGRAASRAGDIAQPAAALALSLVIGAALALLTAVHGIPGNARTVGGTFSTSGFSVFVNPAKLQFLEDVSRLVPASAVVADSPYSGTAYLYALSGIRVLFPQISDNLNNHDMIYLQENLVHVSQDPHACELVRRYDVGYMIIAPDDYLGKRLQPGNYYGVADPAPDSGFRLIAADGPERLYKITICQASTAGTTETASGGSS